MSKFIFDALEMAVRCPVNGSWNCEACGPVMCYKKVLDLLVAKGLPREIALPIAIEWKYSAE